MAQGPEDVRACEKCGNTVTVHRTLDGAQYYLPVSDEYLSAVLKFADIDLFLHDRLRRAERIIVDLRAQLRKRVPT